MEKSKNIKSKMSKEELADQNFQNAIMGDKSAICLDVGKYANSWPLAQVLPACGQLWGQKGQAVGLI